MKKPGKTPLGQIVLSPDDFEIIPFKDFYNRDCIVEQDSLALFVPAGSSALWIGRNNGVGSRQHSLMLLSLDQVKALIATLEMWVDRGTFDENYIPSQPKRVRLPRFFKGSI